MPRKKRATIDDVARLAGVSSKTVSRVFNKEPHVRQVTHSKVTRASKKLDYRPNLSARRLATNRAFVIGMLYDKPDPDYVTEMQYGSLKVCRDQGYSLLIHPCDVLSPTLVDELIDLNLRATVDGFVALQPVADLEEFNQALVDNEIPCVRVSQRSFAGLPWISVGDEEAADEMTEYLVELGHRRIGFIMGDPDHGSSHDRLAGYRKALERHEVVFEKTLVESGRYDYESGYVCARRLLDLHPRPTAIFACNDHMAMAALMAAHELRLQVPEDLSVAGFDDMSSSRYTWPPLTTVHQPIAEVARVATKVLLRRLQGRLEKPSDHRLSAKIVCRASTGRAK